MTIKRKTPSTRFLNVDLDIYSGSDLKPLVDALGNKVDALYVGRERRSYSAHLELASSHKLSSEDAIIRQFCALLRALPKKKRALWNSAKRREFSVGLQAGQQPLASDFRIEAETVKAVAELGAAIVITVYAPEETRGRKTRSSQVTGTQG